MSQPHELSRKLPLGRRGLYDTIDTRSTTVSTSAMMWVLNYSDGQHDLLDIAERSGHDLGVLSATASACVASGLLEPATEPR